MGHSPQRAWLPGRSWFASRAFAWTAVGLLAVLCGVVAFLQYRWIGEISVAERARLQEALQESLSRLQRAFNADQQELMGPLVPDADQIAALGREAAYEARYEGWRPIHGRVFRSIALAIPREGAGLALEQLDFTEGHFKSSSWPEDWQGARQYLSEKLSGTSASARNEPALGPFQIELPRFGRGADGRDREQEWLLLEFDPEYVRETLFPGLVMRFLSEGQSLPYDIAVMTRTAPAYVVFGTAHNMNAGSRPDGSITLLESGPALSMRPPRRFGDRGPRKGGPPRPGPPANSFPTNSFKERRPPPPPEDRGGSGDGGRWELLAWHRAGSLEALVDQTRRRNLALSGGLLLLILGTAAALVHYSRQAQILAETRMNFVAGVSHELRTPLTVIRTAAFNLRGKLAHKPDQVERYGALIQGESERLSALVEQVLLFANAKTGSLLRKVVPLNVAEVAGRSLEIVRAHALPGLVVETDFPPNLSMVLADQIALTHALENLIDNAAKHGANPELWIGVYAREVQERGSTFIELSIVDRGPGIPAEELNAIFEPFYRGRRATEDQVRGTGLGLDLVKKIVEAHGGSIRVSSVPLERTEFVVRLPAAPRADPPPTEEMKIVVKAENEFAHPAD